MRTRVSKIFQFLASKGVTMTYTSSKVYDHYSGKSFYNDGTYTTSNYLLKTPHNQQLRLEVKTTGRSMFRLFNIGYENPIVISFTQTDMLKYLEKNEDHQGNEIFTGTERYSLTKDSMFILGGVIK